MPTLRYFQRHAPFPDALPVAQLASLSLKKLLDNEDAELETLFRASIKDGFFLLNFAECPGFDQIPEEMEQLFHAHNSFFSLPETEKLQCMANPKSPVSLGYKPPGNLKDRTGLVDRCEMMSYGAEQLLSTSGSCNIVRPMQAHFDLLRSAANRLHSVAVMILTALETPLALPTGIFKSLSDSSAHTLSQMRFVHMAPPQSPDAELCLPGHTDNGSITILFNAVGGLQVVPPGLDPEDEASWRWVRPQAGCAVVNLGDAVVKWSGNILRSNIHRVVNPPGLQAQEDRLSGGYFLKPSNDAVMRVLTESPMLEEITRQCKEDGDLMTYFEWNVKRNEKVKNGTYMVGSSGGTLGREMWGSLKPILPSNNGVQVDPDAKS